MAGLFKPFRSTSAGSLRPTLSKQVDGGNNANCQMWAMSINSLVARASVANTSAILQKKNQVEGGREVNGYSTCTLSWLKNFDRFRKSGVKFSSQLLRELAISILIALDSIFIASFVDPKDNVLLISKITHSWMNQFMDSHNIVLLSQRGRLTCSPEKELQIEMETSYHLGILQRGFASLLLLLLCLLL